MIAGPEPPLSCDLRLNHAEKHARQPADEWKEAEGPFGESPQVDDESLGPEEQRRGDLPIIQRFEKVSISAINEVDGQEALIGPER